METYRNEETDKE